MKEYKFKTNIKCGGCVATVTPHLDNDQQIANWNVDLNDPHKMLTVESADMTEEQVTQLINKAGFKAERL